jgi:hypothetical protein
VGGPAAIGSPMVRESDCGASEKGVAHRRACDSGGGLKGMTGCASSISLLIPSVVQSAWGGRGGFTPWLEVADRDEAPELGAEARRELNDSCGKRRERLHLWTDSERVRCTGDGCMCGAWSGGGGWSTAVGRQHHLEALHTGWRLHVQCVEAGRQVAAVGAAAGGRRRRAVGTARMQASDRVGRASLHRRGHGPVSK